MPNEHVNKLNINGRTRLDLSYDTVTPADVAQGKRFHLASGAPAVGTAAIGKNLQVYIGSASVSATSYTATAVKLTIAKTGTYTVSWEGTRGYTSGTFGSQLYINGVAYGTANTSFNGTSAYHQSNRLTGVALTAGDVIVVRARGSGTSSRTMYVGNLIAQQTA